jgi:hypothetical protein
VFAGPARESEPVHDSPMLESASVVMSLSCFLLGLLAIFAAKRVDSHLCLCLGLNLVAH